MPADPPGGPRVCLYEERLFVIGHVLVGRIAAWVRGLCWCVGCSSLWLSPCVVTGALAVARAWAGVEIGRGNFAVGYCNVWRGVYCHG